MPVHPTLKSFFEGVYVALGAAYRRSARAPDNCAGSVREHGIREALALILPDSARIYSGEIIDSFGGYTGQLDGIAVHGSCPALAGSEHEPRLVLAEGVLAVIESKSNLRDGKAWAGVKDTYERVVTLRKADDPLAAATVTVPPHPTDPRIPFIVVGYKGWAKKETILSHAEELVAMARTAYGGDLGLVPQIMVVQLDPPGFAGLTVARDGSGPMWVCGLCDPWRTVSIVWSAVTHDAQRFRTLPLNFAGYIKMDGEHPPRRTGKGRKARRP